jgi:tripartite-type tricarboxylate transporter receptor subunit TctC
MVIGYSSGGGYDVFARTLARHLGKHIPGEPTIIAQNRDGAGSLRAALYLYSVAPKDGTVIGTFSRSMAIAPLLTGAQFDGTKFTWLGSITNDVSVCITWYTSPIKTWNDLLTKPFSAGGEGAGSDPDIFALLYKNIFGAPIKLISGYPGTNNITLAMERGEVDGLCGISWSTIKSRHGEWLKAKKINVPIQAALKKDPDLESVPLVTDLAQNHEQRQILNLILASQAMARPFAAPPGIPDDRRKALVDAFDATMKDPEFLADAAKMKLDVNPVNAATIDSLLADLYRTPKDVVAKAAKAISN